MSTVLNDMIAKHYAEWKSHAIGLLKNADAGEELLSEVMLYLLDRHRDTLERLAAEGKLLWYVNRSIYNMATDKSSRYHMVHTRYQRMWDADVESIPERDAPWLGSRIDNEYLDAYISLMPEIDKTIIRIYMMADFDYKDVSQHTKIPVKTLYKLVENAINKLKSNAHVSDTE
jgi:DNA-directed RNA polymerase specialized sigma24 family protein